MSYDIKFRRHVLKIRELEGISFAKVAGRFGIGKQTVYNWSKCLQEQKRKREASKINHEGLRRDIEVYPDSFQYERAYRLGVSQRGIGHALKRLGVSYKKNSLPSQGQSRRTAGILSKDSSLSSSG